MKIDIASFSSKSRLANLKSSISVGTDHLAARAGREGLPGAELAAGLERVNRRRARGALGRPGDDPKRGACRLAEGHRVDRVLDETHRPVGEPRIDSAGMEAGGGRFEDVD